MIEKPVYTLEVWDDGKGNVSSYAQVPSTDTRILSEYYDCFDVIRGDEATVRIYHNIYDITPQMTLAIVASFMLGKCEVIYVDLNNLTFSVEKPANCMPHPR